MIAKVKTLLAPGAMALLLAFAGAAGFGPRFGGAAGAREVVDVSPSCEPPDLVSEEAILCKDSGLGAAFAEAMRAGAKRIRLFTDGCDLSGEPPEPPGVPVDVVLRPRRDNIAVLGLRAPDRIPVGTDFAVEVVLGRTKGPDRPAATAAITLLRDGERVGSPTAVRLERGRTARVLVRDRVDREGVVHYLATVEDPVGPPDDDTREAVARIGDRPLVLSFGGPLDAPGVEVKEMGPPTAVRSPAFDVADAIVVRSLPDGLSQVYIVEAVRAGTGLVMIGGRGVAAGRLETVLPLTDAPPQGRAALLLLDVSGSMEELMDELAETTRKLLAHFAPDDRVAYLPFSSRPGKGSGWQRAAEARWDLHSFSAGGNTLLGPALLEAERLLGEAKGERRLFVISDGKWGDRADPELARKLDGFGGIHRAALFVQEDVPPEAKALFPVSLTTKDDLAAALGRLEDAAKDRTVVSADAVAAPAPVWLEGAVPPAGVYRDFVRLYPRGVGETIVLAAGEIPVVAAWRPGGKVVMSATNEADLAPLVRAVLKDTGGVRLRAWHDRDGVVAEASGSGGAPFVFDGVTVPARPVGADRWRGTGAPSAMQVSCGGATVLVERAAAELAGLGNRPDIAAAIAASSGGRLVEAGGLGGEEPRTSAVWATLLLAAILVLASAWRRRKA